MPTPPMWKSPPFHKSHDTTKLPGALTIQTDICHRLNSPARDIIHHRLHGSERDVPKFTVTAIEVTPPLRAESPMIPNQSPALLSPVAPPRIRPAVKWRCAPFEYVGAVLPLVRSRLWCCSCGCALLVTAAQQTPRITDITAERRGLIALLLSTAIHAPLQRVRARASARQAIQ